MAFLRRKRRAKRNFRVTLRGEAFTEIDVDALDEEHAMLLAEEWAIGKSLPSDLNHVSFGGASWSAHHVEEAER